MLPPLNRSTEDACTMVELQTIDSDVPDVVDWDSSLEDVEIAFESVEDEESTMKKMYNVIK